MECCQRRQVLLLTKIPNRYSLLLHKKSREEGQDFQIQYHDLLLLLQVYISALCPQHPNVWLKQNLSLSLRMGRE
jgi:hypothetical protein